MVRLNLENLPKTRVVSDNGSNIDVGDASVFPDTPFRTVITTNRSFLTLSDIEIVEVGSVDTTNDNISSLDRGLEGTSQVSWSSDAIIHNRLTAGMWNEVAAEIEGKLDASSYNPEGVIKVNYEIGHTSFGSGLSDEEIHRFVLQSGEQFEPQRLELRMKGGGSNSDVSLDIWDETNTHQLDTVNAGGISTSGETSDSGVTILFRITNSTSSAQNVSPIVRGNIT